MSDVGYLSVPVGVTADTKCTACTSLMLNDLPRFCLKFLQVPLVIFGSSHIYIYIYIYIW